MSTKLILASASPRRKELLEQLGLSFSVQPSDVEETLSTPLTPEAVVQELSLRKAKHVAEAVNDALIIGADTVVVCEQEVLGKPDDANEAREMLMKLQGRDHTVISGIVLVEVTNGSIQRIDRQHHRTKVWMLPLNHQQIEWYVQTGEPLDKAGAYGIQGMGACLIEKIEGCYYNVVGMSLSLLHQMVQKMGYNLFRDFSNNVQLR